MNKEKSFAKELAELINRHSIDTKFETADDILATVAIDALNAYAKAKQLQERRNNPETGKKEYRKPEAFDVPKEVQAMAELLGEMFPGTTVEIHRVEVPRRNPRDKRRGKNKRNGGRRNG